MASAFSFAIWALAKGRATNTAPFPMHDEATPAARLSRNGESFTAVSTPLVASGIGHIREPNSADTERALRETRLRQSPQLPDNKVARLRQDFGDSSPR